MNQDVLLVTESEKMSKQECSVGNCERMDGPECASNYDAVKYLFTEFESD